MYFYQIIHEDVNKLRGHIVSIIGGGGKSSLLLKMGKELAEQSLQVILTSTTKTQPLPNIGLVLSADNPNFLSEVQVLLEELRIALVAKTYYKKDSLIGVNIPTIFDLTSVGDILLIEADGSRKRSLKTHKESEPVISPNSTAVIILCGANVVGELLNEETVHRAELFSQKWRLPFGTVLTPEIIANELLSPHSYLRNIPLRAEVRILINQCDKNPIGGRLLAEHLTKKCHYPVYLGSIQQTKLERIA